MKRRYIVLAVFAVLLLVFGFAAFLLLGGKSSASPNPPSFSVAEFGSVGDDGYAVFSHKGNGNLTLISSDEPFARKVFIVKDSRAVDDSRFNELYLQLKSLETYGYNVTITNSSKIGQGIYVIPSGAMPSYVLTRLYTDLSNLTIIYLGAKDLIIASGLKKADWYSLLTSYQKSHLIQYDGTLNQFLEKQNRSLFSDILYSTWAKPTSSTISVFDNGTKTMTLRHGGADGNYLRLIYNFNDQLRGIADSQKLNQTDLTLVPDSPDVFPGQSSLLQFSLDKTNGTAFFTIKKNGVQLERDSLSRVTDQNVFIQKLQFDSPGDYLLYAADNSGTLGSGIFHVKDLDIRLLDHSGFRYTFSVNLDGQPVRSGEALVSIGNSQSKKKFFINDGVLVVDAKLEQGLSYLNMELLGTKKQITITNNSEEATSFYIKYGIPGLIIVLIVYFGATFTRKPSYKLRFGESASYIRDEVHTTFSEVLAAFNQTRKDLHLGNSPITPQEFGLGIKTHITNGADITEGNLEGVLKSLVDSGHLENHRQYYQLQGEGDVKKNVLQRMIKEKLIENGIYFKEVPNKPGTSLQTDGIPNSIKFITKDYEVGFYGDTFSKKAIIVVDEESEVRSIMNLLSESDRAKLRIMQSNGRIVFVSIDRFGDIL